MKLLKQIKHSQHYMKQVEQWGSLIQKHTAQVEILSDEFYHAATALREHIKHTPDEFTKEEITTWETQTKQLHDNLLHTHQELNKALQAGESAQEQADFYINKAMQELPLWLRTIMKTVGILTKVFYRIKQKLIKIA